MRTPSTKSRVRHVVAVALPVALAQEVMWGNESRPGKAADEAYSWTV